MTYVIATSRIWHESLIDRLNGVTGRKFVLINRKEDLTIESLKNIQPRYVFFPHWSYIIPPEIHETFECVIFHMTDLPFGRGGSPLQNLISRGIYDTRITALRCEAELDAGPVYMKRPLSLYGTAEEIYMRASQVIEGMIADIVENEYVPVPQAGEIVNFQRRKPQEGNIAGLTSLEQLFDHIRMLDAAGYPQAFLETEHFRLEFQRASLKQGKIISDVLITKKD